MKSNICVSCLYHIAFSGLSILQHMLTIHSLLQLNNISFMNIVLWLHTKTVIDSEPHKQQWSLRIKSPSRSGAIQSCTSTHYDVHTTAYFLQSISILKQHRRVQDTLFSWPTFGLLPLSGYYKCRCFLNITAFNW